MADSPRTRAAVVALGAFLAGPTPSVAGPQWTVAPLESVEALPVAPASTAWVAAFEASGGRVADDFERTLAGVHPYTVGSWSHPVYAEVVGPGGSVHLEGTWVAQAVGPAESVLRIEPGGRLGPPELWAWHKLFRQTEDRARQSLNAEETTPATVRRQVVSELADPLLCVRHLEVLTSSGSPEALAIVLEADDTIAISCVPAAIGFLAHTHAGREVWPDWFRRTLASASPVLQASLMAVLEDIDPLPADLDKLRAAHRKQAAAEARAMEEAERARASAPVQCMNGRIDSACRCGDDLKSCCLSDGGVYRCLPPPPR